jgi:hypothetical protein
MLSADKDRDKKSNKEFYNENLEWSEIGGKWKKIEKTSLIL